MAYTFHKHLSHGGQWFICSCFRAKDIKGKCTAYLKVYTNKAEEEIELVGDHAPGCFHKNVIRMEVLPKAEDYTNAMHQFVEERAVSNGHMHDTADVIWRDTVAHFRVIGGPSFTGMSKNQVRNLVYNARGRVFGGDVISKVECQYSGSVKTGFLRYSSTFVDEKGMQRMKHVSDPQLLALLKYPMVSEILSLHLNCYNLMFTTNKSSIRFKCLLMPLSI